MRRDASKQNLAEKDGCLKTKNLAKTIVVPLELGILKRRVP
jgi:hypothetical protein